ncbi:hypothetical protein BJ875DRAFT_482583 [Amylocarpus encephaloides]|uniref:PNPLA domain-containing protein n=1 Tax=Amylocarpus encephaloides TaxID=45428 RepID=A0A9P8C6Y5_9HELO|nr:hypothetical protein BJ875DRAFT_482583 [Amylocarpus encephaloides]
MDLEWPSLWGESSGGARIYPVTLSIHSQENELSDNPYTMDIQEPFGPPATWNGALCHNCEQLGPNRANCNVCHVSFCPECWDKLLLHKKKPQPGQMVHEKTDLELSRKIHQALRPLGVESELHHRDQATTWFGVFQPEGSSGARPQFIGHGRFENLMMEYDPQLRGIGNDHFPVPVVGTAATENQPTSGDVHLYQDPETAAVREGYCSPILYADCEGLQGGDAEPQSATTTKHTVTQRLKHIGMKAQEFFWSSSSSPENREFIVTNFYTRILYTISDVIVFVLDEENARTVENVIMMLLELGDKSIEHSTNQPALPHAIIVLNKTDNAFDVPQWEQQASTNWLFSGIDETIHNTAKFCRYLEKWERVNGRQLNTEQLLRCYYTTVQVIRVPRVTEKDCNEVQEKKTRLRMLLNADQFNPYLQLAFQHFRSEEGLEKPFDFVQASFSNSPISADFADHIVSVGKFLQNRKRKHAARQFTFTGLLKEPIPLVSACIMLDAAKNNRLGDASSILPKYSKFCKEALDVFVEEGPCQVPGCVNVEQGHAKGHQDKTGNIIRARGNNEFLRYDIRESERFSILKNIEHEPAKLLNLCPSSLNQATESPFVIHQNMIRRFYKQQGGAQTGGVRGILQLVVLQRLERKLGDQIPIEAFFHMIVGTRYIISMRIMEHIDNSGSVGGIIAAGLVVNSWTASECQKQFKSLCARAFQLRWPFSRWPSQTPWLQYANHRNCFAPCHLLPFYHNNLMVYNVPLESEWHRFVRHKDPRYEIKAWEAARATSAAPTWFPGFKHEATGRTYLDGGLYHNNPVNILDHERKLVFPHNPLDVLVSIGTGYDPKTNMIKFAPLKATAETSDRAITRFWIRVKNSIFDFMDRNTTLWRLAKVASDQLENSLNSELVWKQFAQQLRSDTDNHSRLNTVLENPPELHEYEKMRDLVECANLFWIQPENDARLESLA